MKITIQTINCTIAGSLRQRIRRRVLKLETYFSNIIRTDVLIKKNSADRQSGIHCTLQLSKKGNNLFAKSKAGDGESAVSNAIEAMRKRLRKEKTKSSKIHSKIA